MGLNKRVGFSAESIFDVYGPLHTNIVFCKPLLNSVDLRIKLIRAKDEFCFMSAIYTSFQIHVLGASTQNELSSTCGHHCVCLTHRGCGVIFSQVLSLCNLFVFTIYFIKINSTLY